jgi:hypothetical protein
MVPLTRLDTVVAKGIPGPAIVIPAVNVGGVIVMDTPEPVVGALFR